jgi:hypothetical protein
VRKPPAGGSRKAATHPSLTVVAALASAGRMPASRAMRKRLSLARFSDLKSAPDLALVGSPVFANSPAFAKFKSGTSEDFHAG